MSPALTRVLAAMALLVGLTFAYLQICFLVESISGISDDEALFVADVLTALLLMAGWILVWRRSVTWTMARLVWTGLAAVLSALPGLLVYALNVTYSFAEVGLILGQLCWAACWLGSTAVIWRESPAERAARAELPGGMRLNCPTCGYSMRGLHEARCPECGTQYTLDELFTRNERRSELD